MAHSAPPATARSSLIFTRMRQEPEGRDDKEGRVIPDEKDVLPNDSNDDDEEEDNDDDDDDKDEEDDNDEEAEGSGCVMRDDEGGNISESLPS